MAAHNTCNRGQIFYRAYSNYHLAIHRKGLLPSGLKTKGQGEETIEIILLGGERWLPQANTLALERLGTGIQPDRASYFPDFCLSIPRPLPAGQIFQCEHLCFISRPGLPQAFSIGSWLLLPQLHLRRGEGKRFWVEWCAGRSSWNPCGQ